MIRQSRRLACPKDSKVEHPCYVASPGGGTGDHFACMTRDRAKLSSTWRPAGLERSGGTAGRPQTCSGKPQVDGPCLQQALPSQDVVATGLDHVFTVRCSWTASLNTRLLDRYAGDGLSAAARRLSTQTLIAPMTAGARNSGTFVTEPCTRRLAYGVARRLVLRTGRPNRSGRQAGALERRGRGGNPIAGRAPAKQTAGDTWGPAQVRWPTPRRESRL